MGWYSGNKTQPFTSAIFSFGTRAPGEKFKEVYSSLASICHAWASGNIPRGRMGASMFFERGIIYSYGRHYAAAKIHTNKKGEKLVLINRKYYSSSTYGHLCEIRFATKHIKDLEVYNVLATTKQEHLKNLDHLKEEAAEILDNVFRVVHAWTYKLDEIVKVHNRYAEFFGLEERLTFDDTLKEVIKGSGAKVSKRLKSMRAKREARDATLNQRLAEQARPLLDQKLSEVDGIMNKWVCGEISKWEFRRSLEVEVTYTKPFGRKGRKTYAAELNTDQAARVAIHLQALYDDAVQDWRMGRSNRFNADTELLGISIEAHGLALLRVKGNKVETSEGADVPLDHALRLLDLIEKRKAKKGERVGLYTLDEISDQNKEPVIIKIGCHSIDLKEAQTVLAPYRNKG